MINKYIAPRINKTAGMDYHGFKMPKGAIYGCDNRGVYVCIGYTLFAQYMGKNGAFYKPIDCKIANYRPTLKIFRPHRDFDRIMKGKESVRHDNWQFQYECGKTAQSVYALHKKCPKETRIERRDKSLEKVKLIKIPDKVELQKVKVVCISNTEAKEVAEILGLPKHSQGFPISY